MSKNGKLQKAKNVEKRRLQMQEALECLPLKEAAAEIIPEPAAKKEPKQCPAPQCHRYVDPSCTTCPYCGSPIQ